MPFPLDHYLFRTTWIDGISYNFLSLRELPVEFNAVESSSKEEENDRKDSATNNRMKENDVYYSQNICSIFGREKNGSGHWNTFAKFDYMVGMMIRKRKGIEANSTWFENIIVKVGKPSKSIQNILTELQFYRQPIRRRGKMRWSWTITDNSRRVRRKIHWYSSSIHSTSYDGVIKTGI